MERYMNLFRLPEKLYIQGSPLLIAAGALLKDNQTGNILAQLKFRNISNQEIKAVKISIKAFDVSGAEVQGIKDYQYLDLSALRNAEFGQKTAVVLPDRVTRSFSVTCTTVIFSDNTVWKSEETAVWRPLPQQQNLENITGNLEQQYQRDTSIHSQFEPLQYDDLWLCSCGQINKNTELHCFHCQLEKEKIFSALNLKELEKRQTLFEQEEVERRKDEEKQRAIQEEEERKRSAKVNKIVVISLIIFLFITIIIALTTQVLIPLYQYNSALSIMEAGEYDKAIEAFEKLGNFKDSQEQIKEAKYREALSYIEIKENLEKAYHTLADLDDYKDSEEYLSKFSVVLSSVEFEYSKPVQLTYSDTGMIQSIRIEDGNSYAIYELDDNLFPKSVQYYFKDEKHDYKITQKDISKSKEIELKENYSEGINSISCTTSYTYNNNQRNESFESFYYYESELHYNPSESLSYPYTHESRKQLSGFVNYQESTIRNNIIQQLNIDLHDAKTDSSDTIYINFDYDYLYNEGKMNTCDLPVFGFYFIRELLS